MSNHSHGKYKEITSGQLDLHGHHRAHRTRRCLAVPLIKRVSLGTYRPTEIKDETWEVTEWTKTDAHQRCGAHGGLVSLGHSARRARHADFGIPAGVELDARRDQEGPSCHIHGQASAMHDHRMGSSRTSNVPAGVNMSVNRACEVNFERRRERFGV